MTLGIMRCLQTKKTCPYVARGERCRCGSINVHNGIGETLLSGPPGLIHGVGASYREQMMISTDDGPACFKDLRGKIKCRFFTKCVRLYLRILKERTEAFYKNNGRYPQGDDRNFSCHALLSPSDLQSIQNIVDYCKGAENLYFS